MKDIHQLSSPEVSSNPLFRIFCLIQLYLCYPILIVAHDWSKEDRNQKWFCLCPGVLLVLLRFVRHFSLVSAVYLAALFYPLFHLSWQTIGAVSRCSWVSPYSCEQYDIGVMFCMWLVFHCSSHLSGSTIHAENFQAVGNPLEGWFLHQLLQLYCCYCFIASFFSKWNMIEGLCQSLPLFLLS